MVFDGQVHVWEDESPDRPWLPEWFTRAHRFPALGGEEVLQLMDESGVDRAVLVQPSWAGDDNAAAIAAATAHPDRLVVMARVPVHRSTGERLLDEFASSPVVAGVRLTFHRPEMQAWLSDGTTDWLWPALLERGLCAMVYAPGRNAEIARIAAGSPALRIAVDSLGFTLAQVDEDLDEPLRELNQLRDLPNVVLKATALPAHVSDPFPYPRLGPIVRGLVDRFGSDRVMWASDLTRVAAPYADIVRFVDALKVLEDGELADFMGRALDRWLTPPHPVPATRSDRS